MISQTHINSKIPRSNRSRSGLLSTGFTLIELLVAVALLALLGMLLVMTLTDSLSLWSDGETQRKQYEEAHYVLQQLSTDLRQVWIPLDRRSVTGSSGSMKPYLVSKFNAPEGAPYAGRWLDLVRAKSGYITGGESLDYASRFQRRVYVLLPGEGLFRATAPADRTFGHHRDPGRMNDAGYVNEQFDLLGANVLYVDFRFWGPWMQAGKGFSLTDRWPAKSPWGKDNNVALVWDSSRSVFDEFRMYSPDAEVPAVPAMVRVRVELTSDDRSGWPRLAAAVSEDADEGEPLPVERGADLPSPEYLHIGDEWIRVKDEKGTYVIQERGVRGTSPSAHNAGDQVISGKGFETTVYIPVYPGRSYYLNRQKNENSGAG